MVSENRLAVYRHLTEGQEKYVYFLLAVAASAIAVAVQQTKDAQLSWTELPLGVAALSWALSFLAGCWNRRHHLATLYTNAAMLTAQEGDHPMAQEYGNHPEAIAIVTESSKTLMDASSNKAAFWSKTQFNSLAIGGGFYLAWHMVGMAARTPWVTDFCTRCCAPS